MGEAKNAGRLTEKSARRRLALLGGTTTLSDCLAALRCLATASKVIRGSKIAEYEHVFAQTIGVQFASSFCSGRVGFYGLLHALGVRAGDEVLIQVPTHIVVANAIRYCGARPVYVDCSPDTYNMDLAEAERRITPRTKVLLIQHTFGIPADLERALALARRHRLFVIEDCVHALGARYEGRMVGGFGHAAFFSTEETKTISTTMGGMVVTGDPDLAAKIVKFKESCPWPSAWLVARYALKFVLYYFLTEPYLHRYTRKMYEGIGKRHPLPRPTSRRELLGERPAQYEQRLSNVQAVLGLRQLERLDENLSHRRAIANLYRQLLSELDLKQPQPPVNAEPAFVRYPVWVENRERVVAATVPFLVLGTWFTSVLEEAVTPGHGDYETGTCPVAEGAARHLINLPTHPRVGVSDAETIVAAVARAINQQRGQER
jgi:dTDP-4-amino-4,6-dideoxygalactose transaminase